MPELHAVAPLRGAMGGDHVLAGLRTQAAGDEGGGAGYEAVEHDGPPGGGGAQRHAGQDADLETSHFGQNVEGRRRVGVVHVQGALDDGGLAGQALRGHPRASARGHAGRLTREGGRDGAGGRGVSDAHVAQSDEVSAPVNVLGGEPGPGQYRLPRLVHGHGGATGDVPCTGAESEPDQQRVVRKLSRHACVDDDDAHAGMPGQDIDGGAPAEEVHHHLARDFLGVAGDAFGDDAVVRGGHDHDLGGGQGHWAPEDARQPDR